MSVETGQKILAEVMGPSILERRARERNSFNSDLQDYTDGICFGQIWARPGIDRKQRSIINLAMLIALNRLPQLKSHLNGALNNGCTVDEIREVILQAAMYCGLPAAIDGNRVAEEVLRERGLLES